MLAIANYNKCRKYMNKYVRVQTKNGTYVGKIVKLDKKKVYLKVSAIHDGKKVRTSFLPFILPLVLFDLLAIALISTPVPFFTPFV